MSIKAAAVAPEPCQFKPDMEVTEFIPGREGTRRGNIPERVICITKVLRITLTQVVVGGFRQRFKRSGLQIGGHTCIRPTTDADREIIRKREQERRERAAEQTAHWAEMERLMKLFPTDMMPAVSNSEFENGYLQVEFPRVSVEQVGLLAKILQEHWPASS